MSLMGRLVRAAADSIRLARFLDPAADPWDYLIMPVPAQAFGLASDCEFTAYLDGPSRVPVRDVHEVCAWLRACEAVDDQTLFQKPDFWQHPVTFEQLRKGDCEDHALWAWRQLRNLGYPVLFMAGLWKSIPHAWVLYRDNDALLLLETTAKQDRMVQPLATVRHEYRPALAVDEECRTLVYQGYPQFRAAATRCTDPSNTHPRSP